MDTKGNIPKQLSLFGEYMRTTNAPDLYMDWYSGKWQRATKEQKDSIARAHRWRGWHR